MYGKPALSSGRAIRKDPADDEAREQEGGAAAVPDGVAEPFRGVARLLAAVGIYGMLAFGVTERRHVANVDGHSVTLVYTCGLSRGAESYTPIPSPLHRSSPNFCRQPEWLLQRLTCTNGLLGMHPALRLCPFRTNRQGCSVHEGRHDPQLCDNTRRPATREDILLRQ